MRRLLQALDYRIFMWPTLLLLTATIVSGYVTQTMDNHALVASISADDQQDEAERKAAAKERKRLLENQATLRDDISVLVTLLENAGIDVPTLPSRRTSSSITIRDNDDGGGGSGSSGGSKSGSNGSGSQGGGSKGGGGSDNGGSKSDS